MAAGRSRRRGGGAVRLAVSARASGRCVRGQAECRPSASGNGRGRPRESERCCFRRVADPPERARQTLARSGRRRRRAGGRGRRRVGSGGGHWPARVVGGRTPHRRCLAGGGCVVARRRGRGAGTRADPATAGRTAPRRGAAPVARGIARRVGRARGVRGHRGRVYHWSRGSPLPRDHGLSAAPGDRRRSVRPRARPSRISLLLPW